MVYLLFIFFSNRFFGSFGFFVLSTSTAKSINPNIISCWLNIRLCWAILSIGLFAGFFCCSTLKAQFRCQNFLSCKQSWSNVHDDHGERSYINNPEQYNHGFCSNNWLLIRTWRLYLNWRRWKSHQTGLVLEGLVFVCWLTIANPSSRRKEKASKTEKVNWLEWFSRQPKLALQSLIRLKTL